jgi:phage baseplate assembly protein W
MATTPTAPLLGWPLLPRPDASGELRFPTLAEGVRQSIRLILLTRPGEQLMHPEFGAGLDTFLHEPNTLSLRRRVRDRIVESLGRWEPRILLDGVEVWEVEEQPTELRIEINYALRRTGAAERVSLVLELEG